MSFVAHAQAHGLIINHAIPDGRWHRVPTVDKPRKRNGAYIFDGAKGVVKNWATMEGFAGWSDGSGKIMPMRINHHVDDYRHARAARIAEDLIARAVTAQHDYLKRKGFAEERGLVIGEELIIPMRDCQTNKVVGAQRIFASGEKRFVPGTRAKGAVYRIGRGDPWLVEGYATGLTVAAALRSMYRSDSVVVCFSAGNLAEVGRRIGGRVVADGDAAGISAAEGSGLPWVVPAAGDANDLHQAEGLGAVRSMLNRLIISKSGSYNRRCLVVCDTPQAAVNDKSGR